MKIPGNDMYKLIILFFVVFLLGKDENEMQFENRYI